MAVGTPDPDEVGSIGEEAAKLLSALQGWVEVDHSPSVDDECTCPLCQVLALARGVSPEVRQHLTSAMTSLVRAAAAALATPVPPREDR
ncbi:MAG TPA: hypothetical protein VER39_00845 [Nocardioidaceae bacterium]|nr:hypothetical protein [Nocardioidaceae bacterium]